ncbi:MAG TPA: hypothetical protein VK469_08385, partial [Candidatus Kapabacteria bacterium]|nr:hypothetical protein [Candidatus Kapabacteria bacterium]
LQLGRYAESITHLEKSVEFEPNIGFYANLGIAYYRLDDVGSGISYFEKALSLSTDISATKTFSQLNKVTALCGLGRDDEDLALLDELAKNSIAPGYKDGLLADWNLLAGAPQPPKGITAVIRKAEELWGGD